MLIIEHLDGILVEATFREIMAGYDGPVSRNSAVTVRFNTILPENLRLTFTAKDLNGSGRPHVVHIYLDKLYNMKVPTRELVKQAIEDGNIRYDCDCGSYLYGGFKYISSKKKITALEKERRPPRINNPKQLGLVCKHIHAVVDELPLLINNITRVLQYLRKKQGIAQTKKPPVKTTSRLTKRK